MKEPEPSLGGGQDAGRGAGPSQQRDQAQRQNPGQGHKPSQQHQQLGPPVPAQGLSKKQLEDMLDNVIRMASESKITESNSWSLDLINHMPELVRQASLEEQFNFGRASCSLTAGVMIYAKRVDETYKKAFSSMMEHRNFNPGGWIM